MSIPLRPFGRHASQSVSALGLGGYHLGLVPSVREAVKIVHGAIDAGITFMDSAWEYHEGESEDRLGRAIADRRERVFLMTKVCTHGRDATVAMRQLHQSLKRLRTDYLDLWQVHECVYYSDPDMHFARGGVIEALDRAKREGKVRYVGFTGHKSPAIHLQMLSHGYPFDSCQLPLNCFDASFESFEQRVLPELHRQQIAALGMKSLGGEGDAVKKARRPGRGRAALCDEPSRGHDHQRHRLHARAEAERPDRVGIPAAVPRTDAADPPPRGAPGRRRPLRAV